VAQEVAVQRGVGVAGVLDPVQGVLARVGGDRTARQRQPRPPQPTAGEGAPRPHRRQPVRPGRAQCPQQEGFGLVVLVVRGHQHLAGLHDLGKRRMAGVAGGCFKACAATAVHLHAHDLQRHLQLRAEPGAMCGPVIGLVLQAVMDVNRAQLPSAPPALGHGVQQRGRIQATAQGHPQLRLGRCGRWQPEQRERLRHAQMVPRTCAGSSPGAPARARAGPRGVAISVAAERAGSRLAP
jgi:hypothetical protein